MENQNLQTKNRISISRIVIVILVTFYLIYYIFNLSEWHFVDNINLIFHEAGHIVFYIFGKFFNILGGTLMQILVPIICFLYFYRNEEKFEASLILFWLSQNLFNIYVYAKDAIGMDLPLLGGDSVLHDWNELLSMLGVLKYTNYIASTIYFSGIIVLLFAVVFSLRYSLKEELYIK